MLAVELQKVFKLLLLLDLRTLVNLFLVPVQDLNLGQIQNLDQAQDLVQALLPATMPLAAQRNIILLVIITALNVNAVALMRVATTYTPEHA